MQKLNLDSMIKEFDESYPKWENKFSFAEKDIASGEEFYRDNNEFGHVWTGPEGEFCGQKLIPGETIVYGTKTDPKIIQPEDFIKKYKFTDLHPMLTTPNHTQKISPREDDFFRKTLEGIKKTIQDVAIINNRRHLNGRTTASKVME